MNIVSTLAAKLGELLKDEYKLQEGVKEQVKTVTKELKSVDAFLQGIDKVPPDQLGDQLKLYASEVREASYDMEDVLDTFLVRVQPIGKKKKKLIKRLREKMDSIFSISKTAARHNIATAINDIMKRLQEAAERRGRLTVPGISQPSGSGFDPRIKAIMKKKATEIIGIEKSRVELASLLSSPLGNEVSDNKLKIVSVVGVGGLGKTTLVKAVYEDLKGEFNCCAFVPIGRNPDRKKILRDILIELKCTDPNFTLLDERQLIGKLQVVLQRDRYFIVIDDVWDFDTWEIIACALVDSNNGSRIIVTTRNSEVATRAACHQYKLLPLSDDDSKRLFYMRIFGAEDKCLGNQRPGVSDVADKILKKCGGVPLAIMTMGGYLEGKSIEEWLEVCNSTGFCGKDKEQTGDTEWILSLSYYDLPSHLKNCLLYLSVFPEDHLINKHALIWMWIAEGFVDNNEEPGAGLFEIGEGYFNKLINRSLIQPVEEKYSMIVKGCRVHDMILDLIHSLSRETNFATVLGNSEEISKGSNARRFALQNNTEVKNTPLDNSKRARSFITFNCNFAPRVNLRRFELLRMLYLEDSKNVKLDEHVGNLHHLRGLGICGHYDSSELPKEIGALKFLLVLYLDYWKIGGVLPSSVGLLTKLVCLYAPRMYLPGCTIKDLRALQELQIFHICSPDADHPRICPKGEFVKDLCNLIELRVFVIDCVNMGRSVYSELLTSVGNLHKLQHLDMRPGYNEGLPSFIDSTHFYKLSHLSLLLYSLSNQDLEILGGLPKLSYLRLDFWRANAKLTGTTACGYFKELRSLLLPRSTVQFVVNEEDSSVSIAIWNKGYLSLDFGSKTEQDNCRAARPVMPNLEALVFQVDVADLQKTHNASCDNLGLEYLCSLQKVKVRHARDSDAGADAKKQLMEALRHTIQDHPNRPTLSLEGDWRYGPNRLGDDDDVAEEEDEQ